MLNDAFREENNLGFAIGAAETHRDDSGYNARWYGKHSMKL